MRHFQAIAAATDQSIVLYNVPARTGVNIEPQTAALLARDSHFVAIKEAGGKLQQLGELLLDTRLDVLCGDDALLLASLSMGGHGAMSAAAQVRPDLYAQLLPPRSGRAATAPPAPCFKTMLPVIHPAVCRTESRSRQSSAGHAGQGAQRLAPADDAHVRPPAGPALSAAPSSPCWNCPYGASDRDEPREGVCLQLVSPATSCQPCAKMIIAITDERGGMEIHPGRAAAASRALAGRQGLAARSDPRQGAMAQARICTTRHARQADAAAPDGARHRAKGLQPELEHLVQLLPRYRHRQRRPRLHGRRSALVAARYGGGAAPRRCRRRRAQSAWRAASHMRAASIRACACCCNGHASGARPCAGRADPGRPRGPAWGSCTAPVSTCPPSRAGHAKKGGACAASLLCQLKTLLTVSCSAVLPMNLPFTGEA